MEYSISDNSMLDLPETKFGSVGIDLPTRSGYEYIPPGAVRTINTGVTFKFPMFGKVRRALYKIILGVDVIGVGGLIWPRSRHNTIVLAGVVDPDYRGEVKVKVYNPTNDSIVVTGKIAQLVPILAVNTNLKRVDDISKDTPRGDSGGINDIR